MLQKLFGHTAPRVETRALNAPVTQATTDNLLLQRMPAGAFELLAAHFQRVPVKVGGRIGSLGAQVQNVYFPEGGVLGITEPVGEGREVGLGIIGREGFLGWQPLFGVDRWTTDAVLRAENTTALQLPVAVLLDAAERSGALRQHLLRFVSTFMKQSELTIVSNLLHPVECRAARWILLYHDRVSGDEIAITHEEFSAMLAVRRASITDALHRLEGERAIRGGRGRIVVRDRAHLEKAAGLTYGRPEEMYRELMGETAAT